MLAASGLSQKQNNISDLTYSYYAPTSCPDET